MHARDGIRDDLKNVSLSDTLRQLARCSGSGKIGMAARNGFHVVCPEVATFQRVRVTPTLELCATQFNIRSCSTSSLIFKFLSNKRHKVRVRCKPNCGLLKAGQTLTITATMPQRAWQHLAWLEDVTRRDFFRHSQQLVLVVQPVTVHGDIQASLQLLRRNSEGTIRYSLCCLRSNASRVLRGNEHSDENIDPAIDTDAPSIHRQASLDGSKLRKVRRGQGIRAQDEENWSHRQQSGTFLPTKPNRTPASILKSSMKSTVLTAASPGSRLTKRSILLHSDLAKAWLPCVASALRMVVHDRQTIATDVRKALGDFLQYTTTVSHEIHNKMCTFFANRRTGVSQAPSRTAGLYDTNEATDLQQIEEKKYHETRILSTEPQTAMSKCTVFEVLCRRLSPASADFEFDACTSTDVIGQTGDERSTRSAEWFEVQKPSGYVWKSGDHASCRRFKCDGFFESSCTSETVGRRVYKSFCSSRKAKWPRKVKTSVADLCTLDNLSPFSIIALYGETVRCRRRVKNTVSSDSVSRPNSVVNSKPVENFRQIHSANSRVIRSFVKGLLSDATVANFGGQRRTIVSVSMMFCFKGAFYDALGRTKLSFQQAKSKISNT